MQKPDILSTRLVTVGGIHTYQEVLINAYHEEVDEHSGNLIPFSEQVWMSLEDYQTKFGSYDEDGFRLNDMNHPALNENPYKGNFQVINPLTREVILETV